MQQYSLVNAQSHFVAFCVRNWTPRPHHSCCPEVSCTAENNIHSVAIVYHICRSCASQWKMSDVVRHCCAGVLMRREYQEAKAEAEAEARKC